MPRFFSVYEAKAKLSELLRLVRQGGEVVITDRGNPIASVIPYVKETGLQERLARLIASGRVRQAKGNRRLPAGEERAGGLARFLKDR